MNSSNRNLDWTACRNVRDLGGLPAAQGRQTVPGRLVRSDHLGRLTLAGESALLAYGIRTVIDLRHPDEVIAEPYGLMQRTDGLHYVNRPLERREAHASAQIVRASSRGEVYCIIVDHYPDLIADVLREIAAARQGGVLIHCHSGKDRTGIITALVLRLAGVLPGPVIADYALSQERLSADSAEYPEPPPSSGKDFWSQPTATPEMMAMLLEHLDLRHGGIRPYLLSAGLRPVEIQAITDRLLRS